MYLFFYCLSNIACIRGKIPEIKNHERLWASGALSLCQNYLCCINFTELKWHIIAQTHSSPRKKGNVGSLKDMGFQFCSKAKLLGVEGLDSGRRACGGSTAEELDLLSPESPGPS